MGSEKTSVPGRPGVGSLISVCPSLLPSLRLTLPVATGTSPSY